MIPAMDDGGNFNPSVGVDAGRQNGGDAGAIARADAGSAADVGAALDAAPATEHDAATGALDSHCHRVASDGGDAGYVDEDGAPCDPTVDGGRADVADASDADAARDTSGDSVTSGAL